MAVNVDELLCAVPLRNTEMRKKTGKAVCTHLFTQCTPLTAEKKNNELFCSGTCVWTEAIQGKIISRICFLDTEENVLNST